MEWEWALSKNDTYHTAENCGIIGGSHVGFLRYYAQAALALAMNPRHTVAWSKLASRHIYSMSIEQFFLSACLEFHRMHAGSPYRGVRAERLFASAQDAYNINCDARAGFTHMLGGAKCNPLVAQRLENQVLREDRAYYQLCQRFVSNNA